jgi:hypothetical protein
VGIVCDVGERYRVQGAPLDDAYSTYEILYRCVVYGVVNGIGVVVGASAGVAVVVVVAAAAVVAVVAAAAAALRRCPLQTVF